MWKLKRPKFAEDGLAGILKFLRLLICELQKHVTLYHNEKAYFWIYIISMDNKDDVVLGYLENWLSIVIVCVEIYTVNKKVAVCITTF